MSQQPHHQFRVPAGGRFATPVSAVASSPSAAATTMMVPSAAPSTTTTSVPVDQQQHSQQQQLSTPSRQQQQMMQMVMSHQHHHHPHLQNQQQQQQVHQQHQTQAQLHQSQHPVMTPELEASLIGAVSSVKLIRRVFRSVIQPQLRAMQSSVDDLRTEFVACANDVFRTMRLCSIEARQLTELSSLDSRRSVRIVDEARTENRDRTQRLEAEVEQLRRENAELREELAAVRDTAAEDVARVKRAYKERLATLMAEQRVVPALNSVASLNDRRGASSGQTTATSPAPRQERDQQHHQQHHQEEAASFTNLNMSEYQPPSVFRSTAFLDEIDALLGKQPAANSSSSSPQSKQQQHHPQQQMSPQPQPQQLSSSVQQPQQLPSVQQQQRRSVSGSTGGCLSNTGGSVVDISEWARAALQHRKERAKHPSGHYAAEIPVRCSHQPQGARSTSATSEAVRIKHQQPQQHQQQFLSSRHLDVVAQQQQSQSSHDGGGATQHHRLPSRSTSMSSISASGAQMLPL